MAAEAAFTPGPWTIKTYKVPTIGESQEDAKTSASISASGKPIVYMTATDTEGIANARLIAAAPELYEALKAMCSVWAHGGQPMSDPAYLKAEAALAKAVPR